MGLKMLMLTDSFGFSAGIATNYLLVAGLIADFVGILALKYFTPKNDYATVTLKFGIRFVTYSLAAISGSTFLCFLAFTWAILSSTAYENITEGHYINAIDNRHQFKYNTVRHVIQYFGAAIGTFLCGQMFGFGPAAVFGLASFVVICQLVPAYYLVYLRHQTRKPSQRLDPPYISKKARKSWQNIYSVIQWRYEGVVAYILFWGALCLWIFYLDLNSSLPKPANLPETDQNLRQNH